MSIRITVIGAGLLLGLWTFPAAAEVVVVVSVDNPTTSLTRDELSDIYLGRLNRFPNGDRVVPIDQREGLPSHDEFYDEYLGRSPAEIKAHWSKLIFTGRGQPPRAVPDGGVVVEIVAGDPNAIGYVEPGLLNDRLRVVPIE